MGRLLQSALGWEIVAHGAQPVVWEEPLFWGEEVTRKRALFWCGATCLRIWKDWGARCPELLTVEIQNWISKTTEACFDAAGI